MPFFIPDHFMAFPHPYLADEDGFLAMCDDLSVRRLLMAYGFGIFPWHIEGQPMWWFYTHPRCILKPSKVKIQKSMRPYFNQAKYRVSYDTHFTAVINHREQITRKGQAGTWIIEPLKKSFIELHEMGYAHSVEVWEGNELVGGLYGLVIGKVFFGESMFAKRSNASKFALISLCQLLESKDFELIDCQQVTNHIMSMGAEIKSKEEFFEVMNRNLLRDTNLGKWRD